MNKLVLLALLGSCLLAVAGAEDDASQKSLEETKSSLGLAGEKAETLAETKKRRNKSAKKKDKKGKRKARKSRKNKKGKKRTKKGKKRGRKGRKGGKGKKRRKGKKGSKRGRKGRRKQSSRKARNTTEVSAACTTCLDNAVKYLKTEKDMARNYLAQKKRIERQNKTGSKKSGKKGLFTPVLTRLADAGGGNKSNLSCFGSNTNSIAKQLTNLSNTLQLCESNINKSCNPANFPLPKNLTKVLECEKTINSFVAQTAVCLKLSGSAACSCWSNETLKSQNTEIKGCSLKTEAAAVAKQKGYCTGNFSVCRKYEDDVVIAIYACSQNPAKLVYKAAQLSKNKAAVEKVKAAIGSLAGRKSTRTERATVTTCSAFLIVVKVVITMVSQQASSPNVEIECNKVIGAVVTCSDAEKAALNAEVVNLDAAIVMIGTQLASVNSDVMTQSGSTPSAAALAAATSEGATANATATTAASGRRRRQLLQGLLSKKKKLD